MKFLHRWALSILDGLIKNYDFNQKNEEQRQQWLYEQYANAGFKSYIVWRDYQILKALGSGLPIKEYREMVGRRKELLSLLGYAKDMNDKIESDKKRPLTNYAKEN